MTQKAEELTRRENDKFITFLDGIDEQEGARFYQESPVEWQPNLRLDWEIQSGEHKRLNSGLLVALKEQLFVDVVDVIVNGDTDHTNDPFLRPLDGEVKRGKELVDLILHSAQIHLRYHFRKDSTEVTIYTQYHLFWE